MEITLSSKSMRVTNIGSQRLFLGEDLSGVSKTSASVGTNAYDVIQLLGKSGEVVFSFDLRTTPTGQASWTNDYDGVERAIADISEILGIPNCCAGGGGGGTVDSVVAGTAINVDSTDPANPIVNVQVDGVTVGVNGSGQLEVPAGGGGYVPTSRQVNTTSPLSGGGDLTANRTLSIPQANGSTDGYLSQSDWTSFREKVDGPASSVTDNIPLFADTTGKLIKDSGIALDGVVTTDGNPAGVSPISSGSGVSPIELRRFVDGTGTEVQANTGSVQFNQKFSAADKYWYGGASAAPTEGDITTAGRALLDDATAADQRTTLGLQSGALVDVTPVFMTPWTGSVSNSTVNLADIDPSCQFTFPAPGLYEVQYTIEYNALLTSTGAAFAVNGSTVFSFLRGQATYDAGTGDAATRPFQTFDLNVPSASVRSAAPAIMYGSLEMTINVTTAGTIRPRYRTEVATSAITITAVKGFYRRLA